MNYVYKYIFFLIALLYFIIWKPSSLIIGVSLIILLDYFFSVKLLNYIDPTKLNYLLWVGVYKLKKKNTYKLGIEIYSTYWTIINL